MPSKGQKGKKNAAQKSKGQKTASNNGLQSTINKVPRAPQFKGVNGTGLSKCAQLYAKALANPWGQFDELPCVPSMPALQTQRARIIQRGTFSGGAGTGFVSWAPLCPTNDNAVILSSMSTFIGTGFAAAGATVASAAKTQSPFPNAAFSSTNLFMKARLVGSGIRVRNAQSAMLRNGTYYACRIPTNALLSSFTLAQLSNMKDTVKEDASTGEWKFWTFFPTDQDDADFPDTNVNYSGTSRSNQCLGIAWVGDTSGGVPSFDFEIVEFWEFFGSNGTYTATNVVRSHADPVGLSRVLEGVAVPPNSLKQSEAIRHVAQNVVDSMAHSDTVSKTIEDLLGMAGMALPAVSKVVSSLVGMLSL